MNLHIENVGKVKSASVRINGITVVAGENDTGKSTVGKTLFAMFKSLYNVNAQLLEERIDSIERILESVEFENRIVARDRSAFLETEMLAKEIVSNREALISDSGETHKKIRSYLQKFFGIRSYSDPISFDSVIDRLVEALAVSDKEIYQRIFERNFDAEFYYQINNIYLNGEAKIELRIKDVPIGITIKKNEVKSISEIMDLKTEVVYIDDPFVIDELGQPRIIFREQRNHRTHLRRQLSTIEQNEKKIIDEIIVNNKFERIYAKIEKAFDGSIVREKKGYNNLGFLKKGTKKSLDIRGLSTGLKSFAIIKLLLQNGCIEYNGTIILDEPEIHLHPEWQLLFAELIVLLYCEFNMHVLLNTHSPYFLNAIEVYSKKYGVADKCSYYFAKNELDGAVIIDVSNNRGMIYQALGKPLQKLEDERDSDDFN